MLRFTNLSSGSQAAESGNDFIAICSPCFSYNWWKAIRSLSYVTSHDEDRTLFLEGEGRTPEIAIINMIQAARLRISCETKALDVLESKINVTE